MPITVNKISLKSFKHVNINIDLIEGSNLQRLNTKSTRQLYYTNIGGEEFIVKKGIDTSGKSQNATEVRITKFIENRLGLYCEIYKVKCASDGYPEIVYNEQDRVIANDPNSVHMCLSSMMILAGTSDIRHIPIIKCTDKSFEITVEN